MKSKAVVDPGFPMGGHAPIRGHGPPVQTLFAKNVCENERIGSHRGACAGHAPRSANVRIYHNSEGMCGMSRISTCGVMYMYTTLVCQFFRCYLKI